MYVYIGCQFVKMYKKNGALQTTAVKAETAVFLVNLSPKTIYRYLEQLAFSRVLESRIHFLVLLQRNAGVSRIAAHVTKRRAEHVVLGAILQQRTLQ